MLTYIEQQIKNIITIAKILQFLFVNRGVGEGNFVNCAFV